MLRALIIDDEVEARSELRYLLSQVGGVEVVGEAADVKEALELIKAVRYDVVFADIKMPGLTGLDLAREIQKINSHPRVVFITAYDEHALEAFELEAVDYLLKPFSEERLARTVKRLEKKQGLEGPKKGLVDRIVVEKAGKKIPLPPDEIYFFEARDDYAMLYTYEQKYLLTSSLKKLEGRLKPYPFFRVHRKYLVNLEKIKEIIPLFRRTFLLRMKDKAESEILVSRRRARDLREVMKF